MKESLGKIARSISNRRVLAEIALGTVVVAIGYKMARGGLRFKIIDLGTRVFEDIEQNIFQNKR